MTDRSSSQSAFRLWLSRVLYRWSWDISVRNLPVVAALGPHLRPGDRLLDVGCGAQGIAAFLPRVPVVGVEPEPAQALAPNLTLQRGTITALPFPDDSFDLVACVDTLEHIPPEQRGSAIAELVRVARRVLVMACPVGGLARGHDEHFWELLRKRGKTEPPWLHEHLGHAHPETPLLVAEIERAAGERKKRCRLSLSYSEPLGPSRLLRSAAARSSALYLLANLSLGVLTPVLPRAGEGNAYRVVITTVFAEPDRPCDQSERAPAGLTNDER